MTKPAASSAPRRSGLYTLANLQQAIDCRRTKNELQNKGDYTCTYRLIESIICWPSFSVNNSHPYAAPCAASPSARLRCAVLASTLSPAVLPSPLQCAAPGTAPYSPSRSLPPAMRCVQRRVHHRPQGVSAQQHRSQPGGSGLRPPMPQGGATWPPRRGPRSGGLAGQEADGSLLHGPAFTQHE